MSPENKDPELDPSIIPDPLQSKDTDTVAKILFPESYGTNKSKDKQTDQTLFDLVQGSLGDIRPHHEVEAVPESTASVDIKGATTRREQRPIYEPPFPMATVVFSSNGSTHPNTE